MDPKILKQLEELQKTTAMIAESMVTKDYLDNVLQNVVTKDYLDIALRDAVTEVTLSVDKHKADKKTVENLESRVERLEDKVLL